MKYISLFSGIEAASVAWGQLGWEPVAFAEIDPFACEVLKTRFPEIPNLGDVTSINWEKVKEENDPIELVVGGSPCQSFSVAGKRTGIEGQSGLVFEFCRAIRELRPRWFVLENVPGMLSSGDGEDFKQILEYLDDLGYGMAWRILDAQFFGLAQRRSRVFLIGYFGEGLCAGEVLFEPASDSGDYVSRETQRARLAASASRSVSANTLTYDPNQITSNVNRSNPKWNDPTPTLSTNQAPCVCMADLTTKAAIDDDLCGTLKVGGDAPVVVKSFENNEYVVRKLMPIECERLQGFPDNWTAITYHNKPASDGCRYKAIGNSMAVPVMRWLGERIQRVENLIAVQTKHEDQILTKIGGERG